MPRSPGLEEAVDAAWAEFLACETALLHEPGAHLVAGGEELRDRSVVLAARVGAGTVVFCPDRLRDRAARVLAEADPRTAFSAAVCARIADVAESEVLGPSCHTFVDRARFVPRPDGDGRRLDRDDPLLDALRTACGDDDWAEGGFLHDPTTFDVLYSTRVWWRQPRWRALTDRVIGNGFRRTTPAEIACQRRVSPAKRVVAGRAVGCDPRTSSRSVRGTPLDR